MQLMKLDELKTKFKKYSGEITELENYISTLKEGDVLEAGVIAQRLEIPYAVTLLILGKAESLRVLKKAYQVFTNETDYPLGEFSEEAEIPELIYNPYTNKDINIDNTYIDLVFHPIR